jgi:hypothetical protein
MKLTCVAPSGGIAVATQVAGIGAPSINPTPSATTVPIIRDDEAGLPDSVKQVDTALVYNVDVSFIIPAGSACLLGRSTNGHYYVSAVPWPVPPVVLGAQNSNYLAIGTYGPGCAMWLGPLRF